jgi:hypothetical protein
MSTDGIDFIDHVKSINDSLTIQGALACPQFHCQPSISASQGPPLLTSLLSRRLLADGVLMSHQHCSGPFYSGSDIAASGAETTIGSEFRFPAWPSPWMANRHGSMHGGLIAATLDTLIGVHLYLALGAPAVFPAVTVHLQLEFLRPVQIVEFDGDRTVIAATPLSSSVAQWGSVFHTKLVSIEDDQLAHFQLWVTKGMIVSQPRLVSGTATAMMVRHRHRGKL